MSTRPLPILKMRFDYLSPDTSESALKFLRRNVLLAKPTYYGVVHAQSVETIEGLMQALLITDVIEDPTFEPIAECLMNGRFYYFWRDSFWGVATNRKGRPLLKLLRLQQSDKDESVFQKGEKKVIVHQIGEAIE